MTNSQCIQHPNLFPDLTGHKPPLLKHSLHLNRNRSRRPRGCDCDSLLFRHRRRLNQRKRHPRIIIRPCATTRTARTTRTSRASRRLGLSCRLGRLVVTTCAACRLGLSCRLGRLVVAACAARRLGRLAIRLAGACWRQATAGASTCWALAGFLWGRTTGTTTSSTTTGTAASSTRAAGRHRALEDGSCDCGGRGDRDDLKGNVRHGYRAGDWRRLCDGGGG